MDVPQIYHPISGIPVMTKLLEILVYDQLSPYLEENNLLSRSQFGFRTVQSTIDAIYMLLPEYI